MASYVAGGEFSREMDRFPDLGFSASQAPPSWSR